MLNLHVRWLLLTIGVRRGEKRQFLTALQETGQASGEVDLLAEVGGYTLGKRSVPKDLPALFDKLMNPYDLSAHGVAYGTVATESPSSSPPRCTKQESALRRTAPVPRPGTTA